jgi:transposase
MISLVEKKQIIELKKGGMSNREIARTTGHDRSVVSRIWSEYQSFQARLKEPDADRKSLQEAITGVNSYSSLGRTKRKYTEKIDTRLKEILKAEQKKDLLLGANHKQKLTNVQIHAKLVGEGFDISPSTINNALATLRNKSKEVFIRQEYDLGDRLEYDFGEVMLDCGEGIKTYHMAVFSSPGGKFRWLYLYTNQKKGVFMDSHVQFFEMMGGCYDEIVYDNMRNVVKKFIGNNEKELNEDLIKMSIYYGFNINVTNCFKGNEKGSVESSVKILRNQIFADNWKFNSLDDAREYAYSQLLKLNQNSLMEEEKQHLLPYQPPLELATLAGCTVNSSSLISVDTVFYSVPEHLVGKKVVAKKYHDEIRIYAENTLVYTHQRAFGNGKMQIDIYHYLNSLYKKPGAVRNSVALKSIPKLKAIFDTHYKKCPKKFIEIFLENKELPINEIITLFEEKNKVNKDISALDIVKPISEVTVQTRSFIANYTQLVNGGMLQ